MTLLLITKTNMIVKIFDLICTKLDIRLFVQESSNVSKNYDFVIVDQDLIDDKFNAIKQFTSKIGAISNEELPFDKSRDFLISRPFLPHELFSILNEQIAIINEEAKVQRENKNKYSHDEADDVSEYIETLADDIAYDIEDESDESIISIAALKSGGILDVGELGKINSILNDDDLQKRFEKEFADESEMSETDWKDLSQIIDDALGEVKEYEFDLDHKEPYELILSKYNIDELRPLLTKCNQSIIDRLSQGEIVDLKLSISK
ncbi:hypothetical protein [Arcobacter sp.]|uniref:hypothetical protein n=1 Tax=unclassified Arcobacter TaxID=2593671 RepID=UPI003B00589E